MRSTAMVPAILLLAVPLTACDPAGPDALADSYVLDTVDGALVPTVVGEWQSGDATFLQRVTGGALQFAGRDSAWVTWGEDALRAADGSTASYDCWSIRVSIRREGDRLVLARDDPPSGALFGDVRFHDTLTIAGEALVSDHPLGKRTATPRTHRYRPARVAPWPERCGGSAAASR